MNTAVGSAATRRRNLALAATVVRGRRPLDCEADHLLAADEDEAERASELPISFGHALLGRQAAELLCFAQHHVHMPVERHEAAHQLPAVKQSDAHTGAGTA